MTLTGSLGGVRILIRTAEQQARTPRDVRGPWCRWRVPSKAKGRKGTRRNFKRAHPPRYVWFYREPSDALHFIDPITRVPTIIATPLQVAAIEAEIAKQ